MPDITITHDGPLSIAVGRSRRETNWRNTEMQWSALVQRLSQTQRTHETYREYCASKPMRQGEIKDVGGFVGGVLSQGRRKAGSVVSRQLLTLDIDFGHAGVWADLTLLYDWAACIYSTHKHSPESPRYRLIIPMDREVFAEEYMAIARRVAQIIGIDAFDHTTYQPERLMYWPSTSKDSVYYFEAQDGPWLKADDLLSSYRDWRDSSEWPTSDRETHVVLREIKKQSDPLEKPGIVGAFCRTYSIEEALEVFLKDVYSPCGIEGRYTYAEGSTVGGLVTYEEKFAYSHHGTDPISGKLCNAFDLVRIHKFGLKDEDAKDGARGNNIPSFKAMEQLALGDKAVKKLMLQEKVDGAKLDFDVPLPENGTVDESWKDDLEVDKYGYCTNTIANIMLYLKNDPGLKGCFGYNEFAACPVVLRNLPWRKLTKYTERVTEGDMKYLRRYLEHTGLDSKPKIDDAFGTHILDNAFHPVKEYLNGLDWDGEERVEQLFIDYQGAADTEYTRAVTRKMLAGAVSRIFDPGNKFDEVLTLVGEEGRYKSSLLERLGGAWFSDSFSFHMLKNNKEAVEQIQGYWIIEIGEVSGINKAEEENIKRFLSSKRDISRLAYRVNPEAMWRQCIFIGTTNKRDFLRGSNGNRRFWPVEIDQQPVTRNVFTDLTPSEVDQIWAEAVALYRAGEPLFLSNELKVAAGLVQREHSAEHPWTSVIARYLETLVPENWSQMGEYERRGYLQGEELTPEGTVVRDRACVLEIWCEALAKNVRDIDERSEGIIRGIMRRMDGWYEEKKPMKFGKYGLMRRGFFREKSVTTWLQNQHITEKTGYN